MKLVIDIPEDYYEELRKTDVIISGQRSGKTLMSVIYDVVAKGTPLPKGHGDLVTKEQMIEIVEFYQINPQHFNFVNLIDDIKGEKPIIEADKAVSRE